MTIKEMADRLGVTKNTLKGRIRSMPGEYITKDKDGVLQLSDEAWEWYTNRFSEPHLPSENKTEPVQESVINHSEPLNRTTVEPPTGSGTTEDELLSILLEQLRIKDETIKSLQDENMALLQIVNQQQQLTVRQLASAPQEAENSPKETDKELTTSGFFSGIKKRFRRHQR